MQKYLSIFLICLLPACTTVRAPETPREAYAKAVIDYTAAVKTVKEFTLKGLIVPNSPTAKNVAGAIRTSKAAMDDWGKTPDDASKQKVAVIALSGLTSILTEVERRLQK